MRVREDGRAAAQSKCEFRLHSCRYTTSRFFALFRRIVELALDLLESATCARTTVQAPFVWSEDPSWRERYARVDPSQAENLRRMGEMRRAVQQRLKAEGNLSTD